MISEEKYNKLLDVLKQIEEGVAFDQIDTHGIEFIHPFKYVDCEPPPLEEIRKPTRVNLKVVSKEKIDKNRSDAYDYLI